ncbi:MAG: hypothetical protein U1U88_000518, partial [Lawsonella clevelandensis]
ARLRSSRYRRPEEPPQTPSVSSSTWRGLSYAEADRLPDHPHVDVTPSMALPVTSAGRYHFTCGSTP